MGTSQGAAPGPSWIDFVLPVFGTRPNAPNHRGPAVERMTASGRDFHRAIFEFDDQGRLFDRQGIADLLALLQTLQGRQPIIIVFVHGWHHNAAADDENLGDFTKALGATAASEERPVLGVYLAWRGLSRTGNYLWWLSSFWDRQGAAQRIAQGAPREVLGRLKDFRNGDPGPGDTPHATLVAIGHSFGGLILYTAISQSLIEAAASDDKVTPSFGDLVVLVNPAFAGVSYMPIHDVVQVRSFQDQLPVFVSVTALNDHATGIFYPLGSLGRLLSEAWRGAHEQAALIRTMGHLQWMRTHELRAVKMGGALTRSDLHAAFKALTSKTESQVFDGTQVSAQPGAKRSPFWVASATPDIIDGHLGIWTDSFMRFVRALIAVHLHEAAERQKAGPLPANPPLPDREYDGRQAPAAT
jgi:hypothetical protein